VVVDQGRVVADGPPAEILTDERIREVFGVEPALVRLAASVERD
jgi:ABC-type cobalamin/Fe3+-siderophores transport system ATPase subunit